MRTLCALLAGAVLAQAFEPVGLAVLLPVGVAGLVLSVGDLPARRAWLPGLAFGVGFQFTLLFWMRVVGYDAWLALAAMEAAFLAPLGAAVPALLRLRGGPVFVAAAWVAVETVRSGWPFSGMPWGRLSYAVAGTPWAEGLPWLGMTGVSFLLALLGVLLARLVAPGSSRRLPALVAASGVLAASLLPALAPYRPDPVGERRVAVVQGDVPGDGSNILLDPVQVTLNHVDATTDLARRVEAGETPRPDFVVWPENSTASDPFRDGPVNAGILSASAAIGVPVLVGAMVDGGEEHVLNQGIVWEPGTGAGDRYTKRHPVPFGEYIPWRGFFGSNFGKLALIPRDMMSGTRVQPLEVAGTRLAAAICFDIAYDDGIHAQVMAGGQALVVQTSNAMFIHTHQIEQQFEITRLRALETGRTVLVAAPNGVSGIIAPDGSVVQRAGIRTRAVLEDDIALTAGLTPAVRVGPWSGYAAIAVSALGLVLLAYRRWWDRSPRYDDGEEVETGARARTGADGRPTYNERDNLAWVVGRLHAAQPDVEVLVVDDDSPDGTGAVADALAEADSRVHVLHRTAKGGLGAAYLAGFAWALDAGYDVVGEMDADGSHQPEQLQRLLAALPGADLVIGSRWVPGGSVVNWPRRREALSRGGNLYVRLLLGIGVRDATAGFRLFHRATLDKLDLATVRSTGYVFQTDLAARAVRAGLTVREVPIEFVERVRGDSKMTAQVAAESLARITAWGLRERAAQVRRRLTSGPGAGDAP